MNHKQSEQAASDLIYLASCAVNEEQPDQDRCAAMDLEQVYAMARYHSMISVAAHALGRVTELPRPYDQAMKKAIRKTALFNIERAKITSALENAGIRYLPLKGIILKELYPKTAMREMSDNDILCDADRMDDVKGIMEALGYTCAVFGLYHHDSYQKPPTLEFEMHHSLFSEEDLPQFASYFADIRERMILCDGSRYGYRMTDEDFYIYILCHMYKHYHFSGTGLRSLLDVYVFCKARYNALDKEYLSAELGKLGLIEFEKELRELAVLVFTGGSPDEAQRAELNFFIRSGSSGTVSQSKSLSTHRSLNSDDSNRAKRRYLTRRLFPDDEYLKRRYPVVHRHKSLYPLLVVYRPVKSALTHPSRILSEYKEVKHFKKKDDIGKHNL